MNLVVVKRISYYPPSKGYAVLLEEISGNRSLPVMVDSRQAQAIALYLDEIKIPRPMTHDLIVSVLENMNGEVSRVMISRVSKGTFFAEIEISSSHSGEMIIDCRPSDAIAVALKTHTDIYISDEVMDSAGIEKFI